jgi:D-3-phosphoglycerate dehydrogenase
MSNLGPNTPRIVITAENLAPAAVALLAERGARVRYLPSTSPVEALRAAVAEEPTDAILSRAVHVTAEVMDAAAALKVISKFGAGVDNIDVAAAAARGIPVLRAHGANALSVAELALMMMLMVLRNVMALDASLRAGRWDKSGPAGTELTGKRLGIIGCGAVGSRLAGLSTVFAMPLTIYDPYIDDSAVPAGAKRVADLDLLFAESDIVSLHCPLTQETRGMIGDHAFALMKPTAILINAARGAVVDEAALIRALDRRAIAGAGLDAFIDEPPGQDSRLWTLPNVVATPHVGGSTAEAMVRVAVHAVQNILTVLDGKTPDPRAVALP